MNPQFNVQPVNLQGAVPQQQRRPVNPQFQQNLQFMSFDIGSTSNSFTTPPVASYGNRGNTGGGFGAYEDEAPLLEELGINTRQITKKTVNLLNPLKINPDLHENADLSGPFLFFMAFGVCQLLAGKLHFGVILGWVTVASLFIYALFNLMAGYSIFTFTGGRNGGLDMYRCYSLLGYSMLPMVIFAAVSLFIPHQGVLILSLAAVTVIWCTRICTNLLVAAPAPGPDHKGLVAYACCLVFAVFSLLIVF